jgi:hypothetical protein
MVIIICGQTTLFIGSGRCVKQGRGEFILAGAFSLSVIALSLNKAVCENAFEWRDKAANLPAPRQSKPAAHKNQKAEFLHVWIPPF